MLTKGKWVGNTIPYAKHRGNLQKASVKDMIFLMQKAQGTYRKVAPLKQKAEGTCKRQAKRNYMSPFMQKEGS